MKKIRNLALTFLFALVAMSCGNQSKEKSAEDAANEEVRKANDVIIYTNSVIEYLNKTGEWLDYNQESFVQLVDLANKKKDTELLDYHASEGPIGSAIKPKMSEAVKDVTGSLSKEDSIEFKQTMDKFDQVLKSIDANRAELSKYIKLKDYKKDNYARGQVLADSIKNQLDYVYDTKSLLYAKIDVVADKAEEQILQTHPLKDPIMAMRGDMDEMNKVYDAFVALSEGKETLQSVEQKYTALAADVEKHKSMYQDIMNETQIKGYGFFYREMGELLDSYRGDLNKLVDVKDPSKYQYYNFQRMNINRDSVVKYYNYFVG